MPKSIDNIMENAIIIDPPALAGTVQGVVVQMAKHKSGKYSFNKPSEVGGALTNLKMAYILLET